MKKLKFLVTVFSLVLLLTATISGVSAKWYYGPSALPDPVGKSFAISSFIWVGSEELPEDEESGTAHKTLINNILNGTTTTGDGTTINIGLNGENSYLAGVVQERKDIWWRDADTIGSMDIWEDQVIEDYFDLNTATNAVSFMLVFPDGSDDTYYLFTTSVYLGERRAPTVPVGTNIYPIYRTILQKDAAGQWIAVKTEIGYAPSKYYSNPILGLAVDPAFDTDNWVAGELGLSMSTTNAIYAFVGQTVEYSPPSNGNSLYYRINPSSRGTINLNVTSGDATVAVYSSNGKLLNVTSGANNSKSLSFTASANTNYYVKVTSEKSAKFTITN